MEPVFALAAGWVVLIVLAAFAVCAILMGLIFRGSRGEQVIERQEDARLEEGIGGHPIDLDAEFKPPPPADEP